MKKYLIPPEQLKPLAEGLGMCMAPDTILVTGLPIARMYRVMPTVWMDSGWRFLAGCETAEYLSNPRYNGIYDVNVIANYSPDILELLDSPPYSAYERAEDGRWLDVSQSTDWMSLA